MTKCIELKPGEMTLSQLRHLYETQDSINLSSDAWEKIDRAAAMIQEIIQRGDVVYGVNTGFGLLASTHISNDKLQQLQINLLRSHSTGVGELLPDALVRLIMILKICSLARGHSGVSRNLVHGLLDLINHNIYPCVPAKGSVGASGDLAPLAHMSLALIGEGEVRYQGQRRPAAEVLQQLGLTKVELQAKDGIGLINGTQVSTALALQALFRVENLFSAAIVAGALSGDAALASVKMFDARIQMLRGQVGQQLVGEAYRSLLEGSELLHSHVNCDRVQDPYSLRCQPQVMGACWDQISHAANVLIREANAVTDNPLVFVDTNEVISGGNFHAQPVAMVADGLAVAIAEIGSLSERRIALLMDKNLSQLPPFLVNDSGLNSGFMIMQVTAAALASENKTYAHPASVDSLPTSANQEDHVSMATFAARRLGEMLNNSLGVVAIELLAACQGIDLRAPIKTSVSLQKAMREIRLQVAMLVQDRVMADDIKTVIELIETAKFNQYLTADILQTTR